jgi:hypothetical protein
LTRAFIIAAVAIISIRIVGHLADHVSEHPHNLLELAFELL